MKDNPYKILNLDEEEIKKLSDHEQVDAIVEAYYNILFSATPTFGEKNRAYHAYLELLRPKYNKDYEVEEEHVRRL